MKIEDIINLDLYPIKDPSSSKAIDAADRARQELDAHQYVALPNFIREEARLHAIEQVKQALPRAHHNASNRNCYLHRVGDPSLPQDHPRNILQPASSRMLATDLLPASSPLKALYYWSSMMRFVERVVGIETLYANEDPMQPVNALCFQEGDRSAWHFDSNNAFTMTLMLQAPISGGRFQMALNTRTDDDQCIDRVRGVLSGKDETVIDVAREEGALCIFRGCNSLHRVSPVEGKRLRIMGVFVYEKQPGVIGDPKVNETVYGRASAAAA